jgi:beta-lactamase regulating signal transducer with metallopeptidase domain
MNSILQLANTFPGFVLTFAVRVFALGFLCAAGLWLFRVRNSAVQYAVWRLILFAMLAMPITLAVMPAIGFPRLPAIQVATQIEWLSSPSHPEQKKQFRSVDIQAPHVAESPRSSVSTVPWALIGLAFYAFVAGILISRIVLGWALMSRLARRMERLDDPRLLERVNHQRETLGLFIFPEFRAGETVTVPVTFGWKNPTVLLPAGWRDWPADKLDLVLAHELSHVQRSDYLIRIASALNKSLYWFHPLSWWLDKRLTELGEHLSDDAALAAVSARRERYAEILGDFAGLLGRSLNRFKIGIAMSVAAPGSPRIKRILDHQRILCSKLNHWQKLAAFSLGISALVLVAGAQTGHYATAPEASPTADVQSRVCGCSRRHPGTGTLRRYGSGESARRRSERLRCSSQTHRLLHACRPGRSSRKPLAKGWPGAVAGGTSTRLGDSRIAIRGFISRRSHGRSVGAGETVVGSGDGSGATR